MTSKRLSRTEEKLMKLIWDHGEDISVHELTASIKSKYGIEYARTTVVTFLGRMNEKGYISTWRRGRTSYIHALVSLEEYRRELLSEVYEFWFDKKYEKMIDMLQSIKK